MPKLSKVHVKSKVHEFLRKITDGQDIKGHPDCDGDASIVGSDPLVVADHELVEDGADVDHLLLRLHHPLGGGEEEEGEDGEEGGGHHGLGLLDLELP